MNRDEAVAGLVRALEECADTTRENQTRDIANAALAAYAESSPAEPAPVPREGPVPEGITHFHSRTLPDGSRVPAPCECPKASAAPSLGATTPPDRDGCDWVTCDVFAGRHIRDANGTKCKNPKPAPDPSLTGASAPAQAVPLGLRPAREIGHRYAVALGACHDNAPITEHVRTCDYMTAVASEAIERDRASRPPGDGGEVERLRAECDRLRKELESTDPEWDTTDGAHPCWWRGHDNGAKGMERKLEAEIARLKAELARPSGDGGEGERLTREREELRGALAWARALVREMPAAAAGEVGRILDGAIRALSTPGGPPQVQAASASPVEGLAEKPALVAKVADIITSAKANQEFYSFRAALDILRLVERHLGERTHTTEEGKGHPGRKGSR